MAVTKHLNKAIASYAKNLGSKKYAIQLAPLPALKLPLCSHNPAVSAIGSSGTITSRMTRKVSCESPVWSLNVRAEVLIYRTVVKSMHKIERNSRISIADLTTEEENILKVRGKYFSNPRQVAGLNSRRQISPGKIIQPSMTSQPEMVERNKTVRIQVKSSGFSVSMKGQALESGSLGDQIQIRNMSSGKVITAEVIGKGIVSLTNH
ncbi:flagellar basal body P-ring formation chaperone FlgA [Parendozoicomonas sp. Alg238-R29]|uniref:flagellar basal body P-ring formation chaperone FlgA n=1 Tax=Parendozoicomonas sp. Alg238-R29 TaxID=2993446 RepID=UPI00248D3D21|nr:flagellar basal body P-ring formation chaperone FlgA [Parendozoicomonas sp. Alg238-R29]